MLEAIEGADAFEFRIDPEVLSSMPVLDSVSSVQDFSSGGFSISLMLSPRDPR